MIDNPTKFRDAMTRALEDSGLSPAQLSRLSGVKVHVIRDLTRGKALTTSYENASAIADALNMPGFGETETPFETQEKSNDLKAIREAMAISEGEMASLLKMPLSEYRMVEDVEKFPKLPRHIDMQVAALIARHADEPAPPSATDMETGHMELRMEGATVTVHAKVDSESIGKLIAKLEALAGVIEP